MRKTKNEGLIIGGLKEADRWATELALVVRQIIPSFTLQEDTKWHTNRVLGKRRNMATYM